MPSSIPLPGTGSFIATSDDAGTPADPMLLQFSAEEPAASFPVFGTGVFLAAASGSGTPSDPYVPAVNIAGAVALPIALPAVDPVFQVDTEGNITGNGISLGGSSFVVTPNAITILGLPTSDPHAFGQLWNSGGVVNISSG